VSALPPAIYPLTLPTGRSKGRIILLVVLSTVCVLGAGLVALLAYLQSGSLSGTALVLVFALLPLPFVVGCFLYVDRYEPEPTRYVLAAFAWGAVGSVALVLGIQLLLLRVLDVEASDAILATVWAPGFEESSKALFLVALVLFRRHRIGGVLDGVVYAGVAGAGFAFTENVLYYAGAYSGRLAEGNPGAEEMEGAGATTALFIVRGLFSPFAHSLFCVAFGIGVGLAVSTRRRWLRWVAPPVGLLASMGLHAAWNGSITYGGPVSFLLTYGLGFIPLFFAGITFAVGMRTREGRMLLRALRDASARGWLHPDEIVWLSRFALRRRARSFAQQLGGEPAKQAVAQYQQLATRLAFAHDRVLTGRGGPYERGRVGELLAQMAQVRPYVVLPPPVPVRPPGTGTWPQPGGGPPAAAGWGQAPPARWQRPPAR
jgi:RsiW-degrading membrane proteinase PrsW (M82 family)